MEAKILDNNPIELENAKDIESNTYNEDYFERGVQKKVSGYQNYSWLPELTIKMAHHLIQKLPIESKDRVLDFGCAKGFLVKALRLLDIDAYGVDVSDYAINRSDPEVRGLCRLISGVNDPKCFDRKYDWLVSKDVFEHLTENELKILLCNAQKSVNKIFCAIPLGKPCATGFIISEYDRDITHVTKQPLEWWMALFEKNGWNIDSVNYSFQGVKDNWTAVEPCGNAFFILSRNRSL